MAIYVKLEDLENSLQDTAQELEEYKQDQSFVNGYDTATDVLTCANTGTIWHKGTDHPESINQYVLMAIREMPTPMVGWYGYDSWHPYYYGNIPEEDVIGWCELPDVPEEGDIK